MKWIFIVLVVFAAGCATQPKATLSVQYQFGPETPDVIAFKVETTK
jgi:hypothetical protein